MNKNVQVFLKLGNQLQWRTKELGTVWKSPSKQLLHRTLLLTTIFCSALGSSRLPPTFPSNVVAKKSTHFHPFCSKLTLFRVGGERSLVLVISLERSQYFWPPLSENYFVLKTRCCFVSCCTMNTLMLELIFRRRCDILFFRPEQLFFCCKSAGNNRAINRNTILSTNFCYMLAKFLPCLCKKQCSVSNTFSYSSRHAKW